MDESGQAVAEHVASPEYPLQVDEHELRRLDRQGRALADATRFILGSAGMHDGMRVLDLGCGAGDATLVAAGIVGPEGRVVGVDRSAQAVARARQRAAEQGFANVAFEIGDIHEPIPDVGPFDVVMGRLVLMYSPDPGGVLRYRAADLRPGGKVVAIEFDVRSCRSLPPVPLVDQLADVALRAFERAGANMSLGPQLWEIMTAAGLRPEGMVSVQPHFGPGDEDGAGLLAAILRSAGPLIERTGVAAVEELGLPTYESRLAGQLEAAGAVVAYPTFYGAWAGRPEDQ